MAESWSLPPDGTVERWAHDYVTATTLAAKLAPAAPPNVWEDAKIARRIALPGRPPELRVEARARKKPRAELKDPRLRAELCHSFLHHELQAAELMAWAILAFPDAPPAMRRGFLQIALDEIRHMQMYGAHMESLGMRFGDLPVNDWFWERVPQAPSPAHFAATLGIGFEGGNLDHAARFAERFRAAGDLEGARLQERIGEEEIPHVRFALHWFRVLASDVVDFDQWRAHLTTPLTPTVMRGKPLNLAARRRAGMDDAFLGKLARWDTPSS